MSTVATTQIDKKKGEEGVDHPRPRCVYRCRVRRRGWLDLALARRLPRATLPAWRREHACRQPPHTTAVRVEEGATRIRPLGAVAALVEEGGLPPPPRRRRGGEGVGEGGHADLASERHRCLRGGGGHANPAFAAIDVEEKGR